FFFQAEDGIRDFHVTGVQTCALPIYAGLDLERIRHGKTGATSFEQTGITDLTARLGVKRRGVQHHDGLLAGLDAVDLSAVHIERDRKSTRLNSSHVKISYAVFCLKKK